MAAADESASVSPWPRFVASVFCDILQARGERDPTAAASADDRAAWVLLLARQSSLVVRFVAAAWRDVTAYFATAGAAVAGLRPVLIARPVVAVGLARSGQLLSGSEVAAATAAVAATFAGPQPFSYGDVLRPLVAAASRALSDLLPEEFPAARLRAFFDGTPHGKALAGPPPDAAADAAQRATTAGRVVGYEPPAAAGAAPSEGACALPVLLIESTPFGSPEMLSYDFLFETAPWEARIAHPNYNALSADHHAYAARHESSAELTAWAMTRAHRTYLAWCITVPSHEIVHVFQGAAKQRDGSRDKWSSEHDASVPAFGIGYHCATTDAAQRAAGIGLGQWLAATWVVLDFESRRRVAFAAADAAGYAAMQAAEGVGVDLRFPVEAELAERRRVDAKKAAIAAGSDPDAAAAAAAAAAGSDALSGDDALLAGAVPVVRDGGVGPLLSGTAKAVLAAEHFQDCPAALRRQLRRIFAKTRHDVDTFATAPGDGDGGGALAAAAWLERGQCTLAELAACVREVQQLPAA